jgi:ATP-dependent DNA ligase
MSRTYPLDEILLPMGGTTVKDPEKMEKVWESDDYIAEEKYDGSRYMVKGGGRFFSRRVSVVDGIPVEKTKNVPHLHEVLKNYPLLILDGEIYIEGGKSNEVVSIMGASPDEAVKRQQERGWVKYVVYDILRDIDGNWLLDLPWIERRGILEETLETIFQEHPTISEHVKLSEYVTENKKEFHAEIVRRGGEGVMLKNKYGKYVPGKKPRWNWIKVKTEITSDVIITGFKPAKKEYVGLSIDTWNYWEKDGKLYTAADILETLEQWEKEFAHESHEYFKELGYEPVNRYYFYGWIGAIEFAQYDHNGELKHVGYCSGITDELRKDMTENPDKYIGQVMEIIAMERTKDGYFRHPNFLRMRPDKNPTECIIGVD